MPGCYAAVWSFIWLHWGDNFWQGVNNILSLLTCWYRSLVLSYLTLPIKYLHSTPLSHIPPLHHTLPIKYIHHTPSPISHTLFPHPLSPISFSRIFSPRPFPSPISPFPHLLSHTSFPISPLLSPISPFPHLSHTLFPISLFPYLLSHNFQSHNPSACVPTPISPSPHLLPSTLSYQSYYMVREVTLCGERDRLIDSNRLRLTWGRSLRTTAEAGGVF